jgi:hypothetical protein
MIVYLPSNGRIGFKKVEYRQPKISDLRASQNFSENSDMRKTEFVKLLLEDPSLVEVMTLEDRDYLFAIGVASLSMNVFHFSCKCPNPKHAIKLDQTMGLEEVTPIFLDCDLKAKKTIEGVEYEFKKLLVSDEILCIEYAEEGDDDLYDDLLEEAQVCCILGKHVNKENIEWVRSLDLSVYYTALFFQLCCPHGINLSKVVQCTCGESVAVVLPITGNMLKVNMGLLMEKFAALSGSLDYKSFLDMTLPDYNSLVDAINAQAEK